MPTIVIIEDDPLIIQPLAEALEEYGFTVFSANDGLTGLEQVRERQPDLVILDIMLPGMDGWEVCKSIRQTSTVPVLMLSALNDEIDRILGLELGADDYLTKPFSTRELIAHIRALLRRVEYSTPRAESRSTLQIDALRIDFDRRVVYKNDQPLVLRYKAFELLSLLVTHAGDTVSRAEIFDKVWGTDWIGDTRTLEVHIRWLREIIEDDPSRPAYIQTVRSVGYRFVGGVR